MVYNVLPNIRSNQVRGGGGITSYSKDSKGVTRKRFSQICAVLLLLLLLPAFLDTLPLELRSKALAGGMAGLQPGQPIFESISPSDLSEPVILRPDPAGRGTLRIQTSIIPELQQYLVRKVEGNISPWVVICCMDPVSGRVLAMAESDKEGSGIKLTTELLAPAASIFKIITAAGAIEKCGFRPGASFCYNGRKHTLYKSQLKDKKNRWTQEVTLEEAFSESINPVFGKIGVNCLKRQGLLELAARFGWDRDIPFEWQVKRSRIKVGHHPYNWAEVSSGFNKETRITVLHGALITAAVVNDGVMMRPSFIDSISNDRDGIIYQSSFGPFLRPVSSRTAGWIQEMMKSTITRGTARRSFAGWKRDRILKNLVLGGKTGTIDSPDNKYRYDWFCGFAKEPESGRCLVVSALVVHHEVLGFKAARLARMAIKRYFELLDSKRAE